MRTSKRLNVVRSNEPYADGGHNSTSEQELVFQIQPLGEDEIQVEHQVDNDPNMSDDENGVRTCGETLLPHVWDLPPGKRVEVKCNRLGQPIGREGGILGQFLGTVARNGGYCPISKTDWRLVKKNGGDKTILQLVQAKFLYPRSCEKWILKSIGRDWRQHKATLKKSLFNVKKKRSVLYKRCPRDVDEHKWVALVDHWKSKEGKVLSEKNKLSCAMRKTTHTAGTKSYARWAEDLRQNDPQKKQPHRAKVYLATHKERSKNGHEHLAELENLIDDQPELVQNGDKIAWEGDALHKVLGEEKSGQVHGMGLLPTPKQAYDQIPRRLKNIEVITSDGSSPDMETHVMEELKKLREYVKEQEIRMEKQDVHMKRQDILIRELQSKDECLGNEERTEGNFQMDYYDNFHPHQIHSQRKRVECNVSNLDISMIKRQDALLHNKKQKHDEGNMKKRQDNEKRTIRSTMDQHDDCDINEEIFEEALSPSCAHDFPHEKFGKHGRESTECTKAMPVQHKKKQKLQENNVEMMHDHQKKTYPSAMEVGTTVMLRTTNRYPNKMHVAYATFLSSDPHAIVGGFPLGKEFYKVRVNHSIEGHEVLVRPWENYKTIGQAIGKAIA